MSEERKLATIRKIAALEPIPNADTIELAKMEDIGWQAVVKKGLHEVGNLVCFIEVDSWVPTTVAPWLTKPGHQSKTFRGVEGERLKTVKLRGTLSQGVILPLKETGLLDEYDHSLMERMEDDGYDSYTPNLTFEDWVSDINVTEFLGIIKYEKPLPGEMVGKARGNFPSFIPKTNQERVQNLWGKLMHRREEFPDEIFEVTEKLDGSSMTVYLTMDGQFGICSRNWDLDLEAEGASETSFVKVARAIFLEEKMRSCNGHPGFAVQGELVGPGVQGNFYDLSELEFRVFDVWNIGAQEHLHVGTRMGVMGGLNGSMHPLATYVDHAPLVEFRKFDFNTIEDALTYAEGQSILNPKKKREGVVFKSTMDPSFSFKIISNAWLLENE